MTKEEKYIKFNYLNKWFFTVVWKKKRVLLNVTLSLLCVAHKSPHTTFNRIEYLKIRGNQQNELENYMNLRLCVPPRENNENLANLMNSKCFLFHCNMNFNFIILNKYYVSLSNQRFLNSYLFGFKITRKLYKKFHLVFNSIIKIYNSMNSSF